MNKKDFITKEEINPRVIEAISKLGSPNSIAKSIGRSPMTFTHIKNLQSLPALETLGALRKIYGLSIDAIIDGDSAREFEDVSVSQLLEKINKLEEEKAEIKKRADLFQKLLEKENFNFGGHFSLLVDNLDVIRFLNIPFNKGLFGTN